MKTFRCHCGNNLHFDNTHCVACGRQLGFIVEDLRLSALEPLSTEVWKALSVQHPDRTFKQCANYLNHQVCNWMIPANEKEGFCASCRLNEVIPNLGKEINRELWKKVEAAKRQLLFTLYSLKLPIVNRDVDSKKGLGFRFLEDQPEDNWQRQVEANEKIITGHSSGLITINIAEADDSERESMRRKMNEPYRTLLGHFRHESGHYFWERLINGSEWIEEFRQLFGNEQLEYSQAMASYFQTGGNPDWQTSYITQYASCHPWEDWAECWAHYLHIYDTLQTARDSGLTIGKKDINELNDFDIGLQQWQEFAIALNALNRSMGVSDPYPFVINQVVAAKLKFIHRVITNTPSQ